MLKKWLILVCTFMYLVGGSVNLAFAELPTIPPTEYSIAGVHPGVTKSAVIQSLGQPTFVYQGSNIPMLGGGGDRLFDREILFYNGLGFIIGNLKSMGGKFNHITYLVTLMDRSATSPSGLTVGDSLDKMKALYGTPYYNEKHWDPREAVFVGAYEFYYDYIYDYKIKNGISKWGTYEFLRVFSYKGKIQSIWLYTGY